MRPLLRTFLVASVAAMSLEAELLGAQSPVVSSQSAQGAEDESRQTVPPVATGITVGTMQFSSGRSQASVSATLQYSPSRWLTLSATPGFGRTSLGRTSSSGLSDLPISAGVTHSIGDLPWSPSISSSLYSTVSLRDSTSALGTGATTLGLSAALSGWATDKLNVAVGGARPLSTSEGGNSSIDLETAYSLGKATPSLGLTSELGHADSGATLARSMAAGVAFAIAGPLTLTVDGSHGLTSGAPTWTFSIGLGTAFAGLSPIDPSSPLRRLKGVLGSRVSGTSGYTKSGTGSKGCKASGTC
jgi:hypothetical protein